MKMLLPLVFLAVGLAAGVGVGVALGPNEAREIPAEVSNEHGPSPEEEDENGHHDLSLGHGPETDRSGDFEYLKMAQQFVVPVIDKHEISALVTLSLSLETHRGVSEVFYQIEPKLRDGFLQVLFDHANIGGFDGVFTNSRNLEVLRASLLEVARKDLGDNVSRVLVVNVSRQDI